MIPSFREGYIFYIIYTLTLNLTSPSILNLLSLGYFFSKGLNVTRFNEGKFLNVFFEVSDRLLNLTVNKLGWPMSPRVSLWLGNIITHGVWIPLILVFLLEICEIKLFNCSTFYDKVNPDTGLQLTPDEVYEIKGRVVEDAMDEWQGINGCKWFWRGERRLGEEICQTNNGKKIKDYLLGYVKFHTSRPMSCLVSISKEIGRESSRRWDASDPVFDLMEYTEKDGSYYGKNHPNVYSVKGIDGRQYVEKNNCLKGFKNYSYGRSIFLPMSKWKEHVVFRPVTDPTGSTFIVRTDEEGSCFGLIAVKRGQVFYISNHRFFGDWCKDREVIDKFYFAKLVVEGAEFKLVVDESYVERYWRQDVKGVETDINEEKKKEKETTPPPPSNSSIDKDEFKWTGKEWVILSGSQNSKKLNDCKAEVRNIVFNVVNLGRSPAIPGKPMVIPSNKEEEILVAQNKQPTWNEKLKSLVLKFNQQRIKIASPKNFLLECNVMGKEIMQFGKRAEGVYALDFCAPMGLLQAFGSCLVAFEWVDDNVSDEEI
ncbi:hypothetical protein TL16_g10012 [Triparma laevis f. inornata]|uniref:Tubby C-terminal domain-containing protein n=1 Tax=Triparma laevis f. inornata TaxID=1714386 RepID=A0A9W7EML8_9STRA|nr:hypothetical protein TL16_g10012 [Triparma laevis f. inornata]